MARITFKIETSEMTDEHIFEFGSDADLAKFIVALATGEFTVEDFQKLRNWQHTDDKLDVIILGDLSGLTKH